MTASRIPTPSEIAPIVTPIVDYEPAPLGAGPCKPPMPAALHRSTPRPLRRTPRASTADAEPPRAAMVFADGALRRVLEVVDRRRPAAALKSVLTPNLIDTVRAHAPGPSAQDAAVLRRLRARTAATTNGEASAIEVFGTFTRGRRVHAVAGRIEIRDARWRFVALQLG